MLNNKARRPDEIENLYQAWTPAQRAFMLRLARALANETQGATSPEQSRLLARVRTYLSARRMKGRARAEARP